jgi:hypothetical protein
VTDHRTLTARALNRATLDRQLLLRRHALSARRGVIHLAGLQGQAPLAPYLGLWTRLSAFSPDELSNLLSERTLVRAPFMRATVHLVDAADYVAFRPLFGPLMAAGLRANYMRNLTGVDLDALAAAAGELLAQRPLTRAQLAAALAARWPGADPMSLAYAVTYLVPVIQVPPRGLWGRSAQATWAIAEGWLGTPPAPPATGAVAHPSPDPPPVAAALSSAVARATEPVDQLVLRYLAAFGPATVADAQTWSGLTRLREITDRLDLRVLRGPDGVELLDLPGIALPDEEIPAPPRFLPEYDNLLLSYADRRRVIRHDRQVPLWPGNGGTRGSLLIDGVWDANWQVTTDALTITTFRRLTAPEQSAVVAEAGRLLAFRSPDATPPIRFATE